MLTREGEWCPESGEVGKARLRRGLVLSASLPAEHSRKPLSPLLQCSVAYCCNNLSQLHLLRCRPAEISLDHSSNWTQDYISGVVRSSLSWSIALLFKQIYNQNISDQNPLLPLALLTCIIISWISRYWYHACMCVSMSVCLCLCLWASPRWPSVSLFTERTHRNQKSYCIHAYRYYSRRIQK